MSELDEIAEMLGETVIREDKKDEYAHFKPEENSGREVPIELLSEFVSCIVAQRYFSRLRKKFMIIIMKMTLFLQKKIWYKKAPSKFFFDLDVL